MSISVIKSNSTLVFFKAGCRANPGAEINLEGQVGIFQDTFF